MRADLPAWPDPILVMCPTCGASPGEPCWNVLSWARGAFKREMGRAHAARVAVLDQQLRRR